MRSVLWGKIIPHKWWIRSEIPLSLKRKTNHRRNFNQFSEALGPSLDFTCIILYYGEFLAITLWPYFFVCLEISLFLHPHFSSVQVWGPVLCRAKMETLLARTFRKQSYQLCSFLFRLKDPPKLLICFLLKWMYNVVGRLSFQIKLQKKRKKLRRRSSERGLVWFDKGLYEKLFKFNTILCNTDIYVPENVIVTGSTPTSFPRHVVSSWRQWGGFCWRQEQIRMHSSCLLALLSSTVSRLEMWCCVAPHCCS